MGDVLGWEVTWQQWFRKTNETCTDHQKKATFVMNMVKLKNLSLLHATISTWAMSTKGKEWLITVQLAREHDSGQKDYFSPLGPASTKQLHYSVILQQQNGPQKILFGLGSKFLGNECKGASSSIHPKRKIKSTSHSNDVSWRSKLQTLDRSIDHICGVTCVQPITNVYLSNSSAQNVKLACTCTRALEFTIVRQISKFVTPWERNHFKKCAIHFIIIFYFVLGTYKLFWKRLFFTSKK
jgi:hypothetical protein